MSLKGRLPTSGALPAWAALAVCCLCAAPAWSQDATTCTVPSGVDQSPAGANFFESFASAPGAPASPYEIAFPSSNGSTEAGDLNATYFTMYYSITNLKAWIANNHYCPAELILVGTFPDARYFSITDNDMHYTATQHLADFEIDPVAAPGSAGSNPFVPGSSGQSPAYTGTQQYLVPVSLGYSPKPSNVISGCGINAAEGDNVLDATQRHLSIDWNTTVEGPGVSSGLDTHVVDTPSHGNPNTAGSLIVRSYLAPPDTCTGTPGVNLVCSQPNPPPAPFIIVRDVATGCAYTASYLESAKLVNLTPGDCAGSTPPDCSAILSVADLSPSSTKWLDQSQKQQHTNYANITPQACYADGDPTVAEPLPFANRVAWTRVAQWEGSPGPDDSYIGGAISTSDLAGLLSGSVCPQAQNGDGCLMRLRFQLPVTPNTPCNAPFTSCALNNSAQLRYTSLTFWYQSAPPPGVSNDGNSPVSVASLADSAFAQTDGYVTLLVNVGATLPAWLKASKGVGVTQSVKPVVNAKDNYSVWKINGYTVLDLSLLNSFTTQYPLLLTIRNTLPAGTFGCSGAAVPFSTAEYTNVDGNGGGLMGPYVPLVDYVDPNTLPTTAPILTSSSLPSAASCGALPGTLPGFNNPSLSAAQIDWPNQSWPSSGSQTPPNLYCSGSSAITPQIYFVATQFPTPAVDHSPACGSPTTDGEANPCTQVIAQSPQTTEYPTSWQPSLPVTIVGTGFGFLPGVGVPFALQGSPYIEISDMEASGGSWNTAAGTNCQFYIANWTDTSISLVANLPVDLTNGYGAALSPLADLSPLTLVASSACPVAADDHLTFAVTNPQTGVASNPPVNVTVSALGTTPF